jgi:hypothetical protein
MPLTRDLLIKAAAGLHEEVPPLEPWQTRGRGSGSRLPPASARLARLFPNPTRSPRTRRDDHLITPDLAIGPSFIPSRR